MLCISGPAEHLQENDLSFSLLPWHPRTWKVISTQQLQDPFLSSSGASLGQSERSKVTSLREMDGGQSMKLAFPVEQDLTHVLQLVTHNRTGILCKFPVCPLEAGMGGGAHYPEPHSKMLLS